MNPGRQYSPVIMSSQVVTEALYLAVEYFMLEDAAVFFQTFFSLLLLI